MVAGGGFWEGGDGGDVGCGLSGGRRKGFGREGMAEMLDAVFEGAVVDFGGEPFGGCGRCG